MIKANIRELLRDENGYMRREVVGATIEKKTIITDEEIEKRPILSFIRTVMTEAKDIVTKNIEIPEDIELSIKVLKNGESYHSSYGIGSYLVASSKSLGLEKCLFPYTVLLLQSS